jgi:hypothetical protein
MSDAFTESDSTVFRNTVTFVSGFGVIADEPFNVGSPTTINSVLNTYNQINPYGGISGYLSSASDCLNNLVYTTGDQIISGTKQFEYIQALGLTLDSSLYTSTIAGADNNIYIQENPNNGNVQIGDYGRNYNGFFLQIDQYNPSVINGPFNILGKVGIKTSLPIYTLDVNGSGNFSSGLYISGHNVATYFYPNSNPSGYITGVNTGNFVTTSNTGLFITTGQTGLFYPSTNPSGYITGINLASYITTGQTGQFYSINNPSGFITGFNSGNYTLNSNTGNFVTTGDKRNLGFLGNVGIGTNNPQYTLDVNGNIGDNTHGGNTNYIQFADDTRNLLINAGNNVGINQPSPQFMLDVVGTIGNGFTTNYIDFNGLGSNGIYVEANNYSVLFSTPNFGIGYADYHNVSYQLDVNGSIGNSEQGAYFIYDGQQADVNGNGATYFNYDNNSPFGINTNNPQYTLDVVGNIRFSDSIDNLPLFISGNYAGYQQVNIQNFSNNSNSSSDLIATANFGNDTTGYVDMGINNSTYTGRYVGSSGDGYHYSYANDFYIGNAITGKRLYLFAGNSPYSGNQAALTIYNNNIGMGGNINPTSTLDVSGVITHAGIREKVTQPTSAYNILTSDDCVLSSGTFTLTLPTASGNIGQVFTIKNIGTGVITIGTTSSQMIDGIATYIIRTTNSSAILISDGSNWQIGGVS